MSGDGAMQTENGVLKRYVGPGGDAVVPAGVRTIGAGAFRGRRDLRSVLLPEGLREIGAGAFSGCGYLRRIDLPEGLLRIGDGAFSGCSALEVQDLPEGLTELGDEAFCGCLMLRRVRLPEGLKAVGVRTFLGCMRLEALSLPRSLEWIGASAFYCCCRLGELRLPEGLKELGDWAFSGCSALRRVSLPSGVRRLGAGAFSDCSALEEAELPEGMTEIGSRAFADCSRLLRLRLPEGPVRIGSGALEGCRGLADENGFLLIGNTLYGYFGPGGEVRIPEGTERIGSGAFREEPGILRLIVPESVRNVEEGAFFRQELTLRSPKWAPGLTRALKNCRVLAIDTEEEDRLPKELRRAARIGAALRKDFDPGSGRGGEILRYLSENAAAVREAAFRLPELLRFLCCHRLIPPGVLSAYLEEAQRRGLPELTALLLNYANETGWAAGPRG